MKPKTNIESETKFFFRQVLFIIKIPFLILMMLFGKRKAEELFIPLKEFKKFVFQPKATIILIVINVLVFLVEIFFIPEDLFKKLVFKPEDLFNFNFISFIASWFLHASLSHLLGNMLFLYIFGRIVEKQLGSMQMLGVYFFSASFASIVSGLAGQGGIGASGAISGLVACAILLEPFAISFFFAGIPLPIILIGWLGIFADMTGILSFAKDNIGHFAHMGGYLSVTILMFLVKKDARKKMKIGFFINMVFVVILYLLM